MRARSRRTALLLLLVAYPWFSSGAGRAADDAPQGSGMFRGAEPTRGPIFDARMTARSVRFAMLEGRWIIEGDIDLGTPDTQARVSLVQAIRFAGQARNDATIFDRLGPHEKERVTKFAGANIDAITFRNPDERDNRVVDAIEVLELLVPRQAPQDVEGQANIILNTRTEDYRWPGGIIPFEVVPGFPHRDRIDQAIGHWHRRTDRIRLVELNNRNRANFKNWVRFIPAQGCYSTVGRLPISGPQDIGLEGGCGVPQIIHEIGHAVGLFHEQSRNDRDQSVRVQVSNIVPVLRYNFDKVGIRGTGVGGFDFDSIMLYPPLAFSGNGQPTIVSLKDPNDLNFGIKTPGLGGRTEDLSPGDISGVNAMYRVKAKLPDSN